MVKHHSARPRPALIPILVSVLAALALHSLPSAAAPVLGLLEEFAAPGTGGFIGGAQLSNPGTGGRGGAGDGYLRIAREPLAGHLGAFNAGPAYAGDYLAAGIRYVVFWLNDVESDEALEIHFSIGNNSNFWQYNVGFTPAERSWTAFAVDLADSANFTRIIGLTGNYSLALTTADRLHWRHDVPPFTQSTELIIGQVGLDGISLANSTAGLFPLPSPAIASLALLPAAPNPAFGPTRIGVELAESARSRVLVVSPAGRVLRELHRGTLAAGRHDFTWDGRSADGAAVGSGVYFFRIEAGGESRALAVTILH